MGEHVQTGLVFTGSVADYDTNRIRKHEYTRPQKKDDRVRQITELNAQTGPVLLAYRGSAEITDIISQVAAGTPAYDLVADDGVSPQWLSTSYFPSPLRNRGGRQRG